MQISLDVDDAAGRVTMHMKDPGVMRLTMEMRPMDVERLAAYLRAALRPSSDTPETGQACAGQQGSSGDTC